MKTWQKGKPVRALMTDDHANHVLEHMVVLNSPEARENPQIAEAALNHIQEHINLSKTIDPQLAEMLGHKPIQTRTPPKAPRQNIPQTMDATDPVTQTAESTPLPNVPQPPAIYQGDDQ
jgi:hypothetical protein